MRRKLAIWLSWVNYSEYYSRNLADIIADRYETTITYTPLDWDEFDVVMTYYAGPNRKPGCDPRKIVKLVHEPHEYQWTGDAGTIGTVSRYLFDKAGPRHRDRTVLLPHGVAPADFHPQPWPEPGGKLRVGWAGQYLAKYKRFDQLKEEVAKVPNVEFYPQCSHTGRGGVIQGLPTKEMPTYYRQIHVYACSSAAEGFGLPILEACACGRPVVSFEVGVVPDLRASGAEILVVESWEEMRAVLGHLSLEECMRIGACNAEAVHRHWLWERLRERWLEALDGAGA